MRTYYKEEMEKCHKNASICADRYVEQLARDVLASYPELDEFVKGMGTWFFSVKGDIKYFEDFDKPTKELIELDDFICEWDNVYRMTGSPVRFTAKGKRVTNW